MVSIRPPTSKTSSAFTFATVHKTPFTISTIATFIFQSSFQFSSKVEVFMLLFTFFQFYSVVSRDSKVHNSASSLSFINYFFIIVRSDLLAKIRRSICISMYHMSLCVPFSQTEAGLSIYHFFIWSNLNFLHIPQWINMPTQSCLVLYSFRANLLYLLIIWLIVLSLSSRNLHLLFCCVLSIFALIWLVVMALFCPAIWRDSVSGIQFTFLSHVQTFSCEMSLISRLQPPS